jgi:hypothetical protein
MMEEQPHEQAIKAIRGFTGDVSTDDSVPGQPVVGVTLERSRVTDDVLVPLQNLRRLHFLNLSQTFVTDKVLGVLRAHPEIRRLSISDTLITDAGMKCLRYATSLEELYLGSKITDRGLGHVRELTKLRVLDISETRVTDKGLRVLAALVHLECLFLASRQVSRGSIGWLQKLPRVRTVNVVGDVNSQAEPAVALLRTSLPRARVEW